MVTIRSTTAALALALAVPAASAAPAPPVTSSTAPVFTSTLSGVVRDDLGRALEGVEVLILAPTPSSGGALFHAMSDAGGRFVLSSLAPGVYRVAAIKSGYIASLGRVNTLLRSSVDLVLRPVPQPGQPGADKVLEDLSWTLRVPPRSIFRDLDPGAMIASRSTGGARAFVDRVQESVRGEVDHMVALGSWRTGSTGPSSSLEGNETRMRLAGNLGERGAIRVQGRRGSLGSSASAERTSVSRGIADVDLDLSYDTSVDESVAMRAFYSAGDLTVDDHLGPTGIGARQSQRSWGYDAQWKKQVDASSHLALQVGFQDASLDPGGDFPGDWGAEFGDAENRAIGAEGSYENFVGDGHLVRFGVRAQRLSLQAPTVRLGRDSGGFTLDGVTGWSLLVDTEDQWSAAGPFVVTYGLAVRQGFDGPDATSLVPRVAGAWTSGRMEARAAVSYVASNHPADGTAAYGLDGRQSPLGYDVSWMARLDPTTTFRTTASYVPSRAEVWGSGGTARDVGALFVSDGFASDQFVAVELERVSAPATVSVRLARGRAEGTLAPAIEVDLPVVLLSDRALDYDAARIGVTAPKAGSMVSVEYRSIDEHAAAPGAQGSDTLRTFELEFAQDLVRFAGGRASCRFLLTARSVLGQGPTVSDSDPVDVRGAVAEHKRVGAGVSLAF